MKKRPLARPSVFAQAVLASTVFCALPFAANAFSDLDAAADGQNSSNAGYPPATGYNFVDNAVSFTIVNNDVIGKTGNIAIDNNNGNVGIICAGGACNGTEILFQGSATVNGDVGTTNAINSMKLLGFNDTVTFDTVNNIFKVANVDFAAPGAGNTAIFNDGTNVTGAIDNSSGNTAFIEFQGGGSVSGDIGSSGAITLMTVNSNGNTSETFSLSGENINITNLFINDDLSGLPANGTTLTLDNALMNFTGNITTKTTDMNTIDVVRAATITGNIGTATEAFHKLQVLENIPLTFTGNLFATTTEFQTGGTLSLGNNSSINGDVTTINNGDGNLFFIGNGTVTGTIGEAAKALNAVVLSGAGNTVNLQGNVFVDDAIQFVGASNAASTVSFGDNVTITGNIDNDTLDDGAGIALFLGNGTVTGIVGDSKQLAAVHLSGAGSTVNFESNINLTGNINFIAGSDTTTTASLANNVILNGGADNTSGTPNFGILQFEGSGQVQGRIGETSPINQLIVNSDGNANALVTLFGDTVNAATIHVNDDGLGVANATTLQLDNVAMVLNADITTKTNDMNTLDILNAQSLTGNIGTATEAFHLIKVAQNINTTLTGNIFATTTELQGDNSLILGDNTTITGLVDTKMANQGTLVFLGSGTIIGDTGSINFLKGVEMQGAAGVADFQGTLDAGTFNFTPNADNATTGKFQNTVNLVSVDNLTGVDGNGNLLFLADGLIQTTVGATNALNLLTFQGAGKNVQFSDTVKANSIIFSGTADPTTTAQFDVDLIINSINNQTTTDGNGRVLLLSNATVSGNTGATHSIGTIEMQSAGALAEFQGTINTENFIFSATADATTTAQFTNMATIGIIDNLTGGDGVGLLIFKNNGTVTNTVGATNKIDSLILEGAVSSVEFQDAVRANQLLFQANASNITTARFNNNVELVTIDNLTGTDNVGIVTFSGTGTSTISGNVGATNDLNTLKFQGPNGTTVFQGTVEVNSLQFSGTANADTKAQFDNAVTLNSINNTTGAAGNGTLLFASSADITGNVGFSNAINSIVLQGAGKSVTFEESVASQNLIFNATANSVTTAVFEKEFELGAIDNITAADGNGTVVFQDGGTVSGTVGATKAINLINLEGAGKTVLFEGDIKANTLAFNNTADATTTASIADSVIINANIDNTIGVNGKGILSFVGSGTVNGTIGATNSLNAVDVLGAGSTVQFMDDVLNGTPIRIHSNAIVSINDGVTVTGNVDNVSGIANVGELRFLGGGAISGSIGTSNPLALVTINSDALANKTVALSGATNRATIFHINDDGATPTTLSLSNTVLTGNITTKTNNLNIIDIINPTTINGDIGTVNEQFALIKIGGNTTLNGSIFATNTQFQANKTLTILDGSTLNSPVTTLVNNTGQLIFNGSAEIVQPIGAAGFSLNTVQINGAPGTTVNMNETIYATTTSINQGGTLHIVGDQTIHGNLLVNNGILSLSDTTTPLQINGAFQLNNSSQLTLDLGGDLTAGFIQATGPANVNTQAVLHVENVPAGASHGETIIPIIFGNNGSILNPIAVTGNNILLDFTTEVDNVNHQLNLVVTATSPAGVATQPNTTGIANALGALIPFNIGGTLGAILDSLGSFTSVEQLNQALAQLAPTVDNSVIAQGFYTQLQTYHHVSGRMNESFITRILRQTDKKQGVSMGDASSCYAHRGVWVDIFGHYGDQNIRQQVDGYRDHTAGIMLGGDLVAKPNILAGFAMSYADADISNLVSPNAHTDIDNYQAMLYGQYLFERPLYVNGYVSYGYNRYQATRYVSFADLALAPQADFHAWQYGAKAEVGYGFESCIFYIIPNASLYYARLALTEYVENGVGNANQQVNSQDYNLLQSSVGMKVQTDMAHGDTMIQPEVHLQVFYNIVNDNMQITSQFTGAGPNFVTQGATQPKGSFNLGASITAFDNERTGFVATFSYDYLAQNNYHSHSGSFNVRYEW